jgi:Transposase DDE domain
MAAKKSIKPGTPPSRRHARGELTQTALRDLLRWHETVVGGKHIRSLERLIQELRQTDAHGNRNLFLDDVFIAYLLAFFNPTLRTLRTLEDFSQTQQAQKHLSIPKLCKSTLSDFNKLADPSRLQPILDHLRREVLKPGRGPTSNPLEDLHRRVLAVDGTFLKIAADVTWAIGRSGKKRGARLDFHVDINTWLPEVVVVATKGESEAKNAQATITPGAIHLYDRGIFSFGLIKAHVEAKADFVMRIREAGVRCPKFEATEIRELSEAARQAGVTSDRVGSLVGSQHRRAPDMMLREVVIIPADDPNKPVRLLTNLLDLDASIIGLLYRNRWQIELFFRWLKCYARFDHLISHERDGVLLSFYVAVVGATLMYLHTGHRPSKYLFSLMGLVASGSASMEEIMPILRERERRNQLERDRVARKRAEKAK